MTIPISAAANSKAYCAVSGIFTVVPGPYNALRMSAIPRSAQGICVKTVKIFHHLSCAVGESVCAFRDSVTP